MWKEVLVIVLSTILLIESSPVNERNMMYTGRYHGPYRLKSLIPMSRYDKMKLEPSDEETSTVTNTMHEMKGLQDKQAQEMRELVNRHEKEVKELVKKHKDEKEFMAMMLSFRGIFAKY